MTEQRKPADLLPKLEDCPWPPKMEGDMGYTPGPWSVIDLRTDGVHRITIAGGGKAVCRIDHMVDQKPLGDEDEANARLIAESPTMYDLLIIARDELANGIETESPVEAEHSIFARKLVAKIDEAIARIKGES